MAGMGLGKAALEDFWKDELGFLFFFLNEKKFFWPHYMACGILISLPGIEPVPLAFEGWSLNHWTTKEVPELGF